MMQAVAKKWFQTLGNRKIIPYFIFINGLSLNHLYYCVAKLPTFILCGKSNIQ